MFFKIGVYKNIATVITCVEVFLIKLKKEEAPTQVFSDEHCEIFKNNFLYRTTTFGGCFCRSIGHLPTLSLLIRNTVWDGFC